MRIATIALMLLLSGTEAHRLNKAQKLQKLALAQRMSPAEIMEAGDADGDGKVSVDEAVGAIEGWAKD